MVIKEQLIKRSLAAADWSLNNQVPHSGDAFVYNANQGRFATARRKGKWSGGRPILGYDTVPQGGRVAVNEEEAERVREIFEMYLHYKSLIPTVRELNRRGWRTKAWTSRKGKPLAASSPTPRTTSTAC